MSLSFWDNYSNGPRKLTAEEEANVKELKELLERTERESGLRSDVVLFGKKVRYPVGIASGPAPNFKWLTFFSELGYGILTFKTMRDREWRGHGMPNLLYVSGNFRAGFVAVDDKTGSITNSLGMPTPKPGVWKQDARRIAQSKRDCFFVVSVTATLDGGGEEDVLGQFAELAVDSKRSGADAVELNLSCPNVLPGEGGETYTDAKLSGRVVDAVRRGVGSSFPIFVKVGYLSDYRALVDETYDERVAYVAINSVPGVVRDSLGEALFSDRGGKAGICGAAIREKARDAVSKLASLRREGREFTIIGLGGVLGARDAIALKKRGANVVECATGALLDPCMGLKISLGLLEAKARASP
jgi:dihydroorotate dehydrogenase (NAD+) catalytic subunit